MAQNVTIAGAAYSDVPAINVPKTGGGTAEFVDTTDANAAAADIAKGKVAYVDGAKVIGTAEGAKPEQAKTLTLGAAAPSTVTPDSGKVLSSVPVVLDTSVIKAANIAKGVTMLGIPGAHEGGGGGGGETCTITVSGSQNLYICYTDENGNFINGETIQKGTSKTIPKRHFLAKGADPEFRGTPSGAKIYTPNSYNTSTTLNETYSVSAITWNLFVPTSSTISFVTSCFLPDSLITLADGTKKQIKDLTYSDSLKVWNFDTGEYDTAPICWLTRSGLYSDHYYKLTFSDGTILKTTGQNSNHKVYNVDERFFKGVDKTEIGDRIFSENGIVTVVNKEYIEGDVEYYNLITTHKINCFAEGILTSDRYGNLYPIDENMVYVKEGREIRPYSEFEAVGIKRYWYDTLRLGEVTGTAEETKLYIDKLECQMVTPDGFN